MAATTVDFLVRQRLSIFDCEQPLEDFYRFVGSAVASAFSLKQDDVLKISQLVQCFGNF